MNSLVFDGTKKTRPATQQKGMSPEMFRFLQNVDLVNIRLNVISTVDNIYTTMVIMVIILKGAMSTMIIVL